MTIEPRECLRVEGIVVPLDEAPGHLRTAYEQAQLAVKSAPLGPARNKCKAEVNRIAKEILVAWIPKAALKNSRRGHGAAGFFEMTKARSLA
jgi:hypothetical protein